MITDDLGLPIDRSRAVFQRAQACMPNGNSRHTVFFAPQPVYAANGHGSRLLDVDGNPYLDCVNNYSSLIHGHGHPQVLAAAREQIVQLISVGLPTEAEVMLAELLCERIASVDEIRFANTGTEAVMLAIKAARAYTGRGKIAKIEGAYHGLYDSAEISQAPSPAAWGPPDRPASVAMSHGTPAGLREATIVLPMDDIVAARAILETHRDDLAGVLMDVAPSHIGYLQPSDAFWTMIREFTRANGSLFILDEVYSFRHAVGGAQARFGLDPDLTVLGKIIGGGFPIGAVGGRREYMSVFRHDRGTPQVPHGGTFNANPVSMRAGHAAMLHYDSEAVARLDALGERVRRALGEAIAVARFPAQVTGLGSLAAFIMREGPLLAYRDVVLDAEQLDRRGALHRGLLARGVLIDPRGTVVLSTAMNEADIDELAEKTLAVLRRLR